MIRTNLFLSSGNASLFGSSDLLLSVLSFLALFSSSAINFSQKSVLKGKKQSMNIQTIKQKTNPNQAVLGFKFLTKIHGIVNKGKSWTSSATVFALEAICNNQIRCRLVDLGNFFANLGFWHGRTAGVNHFHNLNCNMLNKNKDGLTISNPIKKRTLGRNINNVELTEPSQYYQVVRLRKGLQVSRGRSGVAIHKW